MKILFALFHKEAIKLSRCSVFGFILALGNWPYEFHKLSFFLGAEKVRYLIGIEKVIDVLDKGLVFDFTISKQKDGRFVFASGLLEYLFEIFLPLCLAVGLRNLDLEYRVLADLGGETSQTLPS